MNGREEKVLQQGDESNPWSHGICVECIPMLLQNPVGALEKAKLTVGYYLLSNSSN